MNTIRFLFINILLLFAASLYAQEEEISTPPDTMNLEQFYDMTLEQLDSVKTSGISSDLESFINSLIWASAKKSLSKRNNPNVVTLISREEIQKSGSRDLIDVLSLVPGFHFAQDQYGDVGLGIRGNWANEGKVLVLVNGHEMNEIYTANNSFGSHFPIDLIERIEIIRGPGSVNYGGFAEYGVINIILTNADDFSGVKAHIGQGMMNTDFSNQSVSLYSAFEKDDWQAGFALNVSSDIRSNHPHYAFYKQELQDSLGYGKKVPMSNSSGMESGFGHAYVQYKGLKVSHISDFYRVTNVNLINEYDKYYQRVGVLSNSSKLEWKIKLNDKMNIRPYFNFCIQQPWEVGTTYAENLSDTAINDSVVADRAIRYQGGIDYEWTINHRINFQAGVDMYSIYANNQDVNSVFNGGDSSLNYTNQALYAQLYYRTPFVNIIAGGRLEGNSNYKMNLLPRVALTKAFKRFHYKLLYSQAIHTPSIGNIYRSFNGQYEFNSDSTEIVTIYSGLEPEKTYVWELELGYHLKKNYFFTLNLFDVTTHETIAYAFYQDEIIREKLGEDQGFWAYQNFDASGTLGFEAGLRWQNEKAWAEINYSFYNVTYKPRIQSYSVNYFSQDPNDQGELVEDALLAFPNHKITVNTSYSFKHDITLSMSAIIMAKRYGYDMQLYEDTSSTGIVGGIKQFQPTCLLNVFVQKENLFIDGLKISLGMYNILNKEYYYLQPYLNFDPVLPAAGREIYLKLSYQVPMKKKSIK